MASTVPNDRQVPNPLYSSWARYKPGTSVTFQFVQLADDEVNQKRTTTTLVDVSAERVVLRMVTCTDGPGGATTAPFEFPVAANAPLPPQPASAPTATNPALTRTTTSEVVSVAGIDFACERVETDISTNYQANRTATWTSPDMPGLIVKVNSRAGAGSVMAETKLEVVAVELLR